jgi:hypothetical protein
MTLEPAGALDAATRRCSGTGGSSPTVFRNRRVVSGGVPEPAGFV